MLATAETGREAQPDVVSSGWFRSCTSAVPCTAEADETTVSTASSWKPRRVVAPQLIIVAFSFATVTATVSARLPTKGTSPSTPSGNAMSAVLAVAGRVPRPFGSLAPVLLVDLPADGDLAGRALLEPGEVPAAAL